MHTDVHTRTVDGTAVAIAHQDALYQLRFSHWARQAQWKSCNYRLGQYSVATGNNVTLVAARITAVAPTATAIRSATNAYVFRHEYFSLTPHHVEQDKSSNRSSSSSSTFVLTRLIESR